MLNFDCYRSKARPCSSGLAGLAAPPPENEKSVWAGQRANPAKVAKFRTCQPLTDVSRASAIVSEWEELMANSATEGTAQVSVKSKDGETRGETFARVLSNPFLRHGAITGNIGNNLIAKSPDNPSRGDYAMIIKKEAERATNGDLTMASETLTAQAMTLDAIFTEMARRSLLNLGEYPLAAERYMRLALKAQSNSRATLAELAKLHQPREQTVRHVHVNDGGQAVIADEFHNHAGGKENANSAEQPHATGTGAAGASPALPSPDTIGEAVPVTSGERKPPLQNARRQGKRRAQGK